MRLIRTETYFSWDKIEKKFLTSDKFDPGIAAVWLGTNTNRTVEFKSVRGFKSFAPFGEGARQNQDYRDYLIERFLDLSLRGARQDVRSRFETEATRGDVWKYFRSSTRIYNVGLIESVLTGRIIIERSPPEGIPLGGMLGNNAFIAVGTWLGFHAGGDGWIMLISIPGGVILMGAAIGISRGLMTGLHRAVDKAIQTYLEKESN